MAIFIDFSLILSQNNRTLDKKYLDHLFIFVLIPVLTHSAMFGDVMVKFLFLELVVYWLQISGKL